MLDTVADNLNTHEDLNVLKRLRNEPQRLLDNARFLGFLSDEARERFRQEWLEVSSGTASSPSLAELGRKLDELRKNAMHTKDFSEVDRLKAALVAAGVEVRMSKQGVEILPAAGFDPVKLEALQLEGWPVE